MRPATGLLVILCLFGLVLSTILPVVRSKMLKQENDYRMLQTVVSALALSDLAMTTEARYTRHPAVTDGVVPWMDHPGAIEHFPSSLFLAPPD